MNKRRFNRQVREVALYELVVARIFQRAATAQADSSHRSGTVLST